jgi:hypothetical protein
MTYRFWPSPSSSRTTLLRQELPAVGLENCFRHISVEPKNALRSTESIRMMYGKTFIGSLHAPLERVLVRREK